MKKLVPLSILLSATVHAATFEERVDSANAAFATEQGELYERTLGPHIQAAIRKCASGGSVAKESAGKFVLVADVSAQGKIVNPVVKPETPTSVCFSREFGAQVLSPPPDSLVSEGFAPLVVEVYIVP